MHTRLENGISESKACNEEAENQFPLGPFTALNLTSVVTALYTSLVTYTMITYRIWDIVITSGRVPSSVRGPCAPRKSR